MTLSVEMIAESMQPFGARVVMQQERTFAFRRVQMLTPESENTLEEDVLYVSEPKVIRRLPKGLLHDHFFVVRARPEDAEPVRPGVNALLYDEQYSLGAVTNHLLTLFDRLQTLEYQMRLAVRAHAGLEPLMEVGRKMIPDATIVVVDSAYNIIGATRERGSGNIYVDQMLEQGYYDKDSLQLMAEAGYFEVSDRYLRPVLSVPPNICNDPVILRSYIANGMFYSFAGCYFPGRLPTMVDQELFRCFTEQLDHYFRETGFYSQSMPQRQQMIHDLLRYGEENPELVRDRARGLRLPETGDFRLGYVEFDEQASTSKAGYMVLQLRAWSNVANYGVMQYQNSVLILFQDWHDYPVGEQLLFRERWDELLTLLGKNHARLRQDRAVAAVVLAGLADIAEVFFHTLLQRRHRHHLALAAKERRVVAHAEHEVKLCEHGVVVALGGEKAAGRDQHMPLVRLVVARDVLTVALAVGAVAHDGAVDRHRAVEKALELAGQGVVVEREAPHDEVGRDVAFDRGGHVVVAEALARRALPAVEAAEARLNVHFGHGQFFDLRVAGLGEPFEKGARHAQRVAALHAGTSVDDKNVHGRFLLVYSHV